MPAKAVKSILVVCLLSLALPVASATAKTVEKTVPGELVFQHGQRPGDPGNCSGVVFAQWKDVPGTVSATAYYVYRGAETSKSAQPPFNDVYEWVATYTVSPGAHWIQLGVSWADGPVVNTCADVNEKQRAVYTGPVRVELTVEIDPKVCKDAQAKLSARRKVVTTVRKRLNNATTQKAKNKLRGKLERARTKRATAAKRVTELC